MIIRRLACLGFAVVLAVPACSGSGGAGALGTSGSGGTAQQGGNGQGGKQASAGAAGKATAGSTSNGGSPAAGGGSSAGGSTAGVAGTAAGGGLTGDGGAGPGDGGAGPGGGGTVKACLDAPVIGDVWTEALEFEGAGLKLAIVRRNDPDAVGTSGTIPWLPERFGLERGVVAECVSNVNDLSYTISHHNFDDKMTASVGGDTWIFKQTRVDYNVPTLWTVEARQGATLLWGPVTLTLVSCTRLDTNASCTATYQ